MGPAESAGAAVQEPGQVIAAEKLGYLQSSDEPAVHGSG